MVLYVTKWDIIADKAAAYAEWAQTAIPRILAAPGLVEFRGYRPVTGNHQVVVTYEFADMETWAEWRSSEEIKTLFDEEARTYITNFTGEVWGPSPVVPEPIRPGQ